jgi:ligand-binding sensor domain-containing protein
MSTRKNLSFIIPGGILGKLPREYIGVNSLYATPNGDLWIEAFKAAGSSFQADPLLFSNGEFVRQQGETIPHIYFNKKLWGVGQTGIELLVENHWESQKDSPFKQILCWATGNSTLWIGTLTQGLWRSEDGFRWEREHLTTQGLDGDYISINALCVDSSDSVLVAAASQSKKRNPILRRQFNGWDSLPLPEKQNSFHPIVNLLTDLSGRVWAASYNKGVWSLFNGIWTHYPGGKGEWNKPVLPGATLSGMYVDRQNRVWAATHNGIGCFTDNIWHYIFVQPTNYQNSGFSLRLDAPGAVFSIGPNDKLWFATRQGGLIGWIDTNSLLMEVAVDQRKEDLVPVQTVTINEK